MLHRPLHRPLVPLLLLLAGCGAEPPLDPGPDGDFCAEAGSGDDLVPLPPTEASPPEATELLFAVSRFYLGRYGLDADDGTPPWRDYGFNLDRTTSPAYEYCTCYPASSANGEETRDGTGGRDNVWGKEILPLLDATQGGGLEEKLNLDVEAGSFSWVVRIHGVGGAPSQAGLTAGLYEAAPRTGPDGALLPPAFDGTDVWPVVKDGVVGFDADLPLLWFSDAYVVPGADGSSTWVGRGEGSIRLRMSKPLDVSIVIDDPVLVLPLSADRTKIARGMLGGTLDLDALAAEIGRAAGNVDESYCPPSGVLNLLVNQVRSSADMLAAGAIDTTKECDRASIGIAFDAAAIAGIGPVVNGPEPAPSSCPPP